MTTDNHADAGGDLLFVDARTGWAWLAAGLAALVLCGMAVAICLNADSPQEWLGALACGFFGAFAGYFAWFAFGTRDDHSRFYADRVETFRGRKLLHRLKYADVQRVAYGFRADGSDEFLSFSGPGRKPLITITAFSSDADSAAGDALTPQKLQALRDQLYDVVAARMRREIDAGRTVPWFGPIRISAKGLQVGDRGVPWAQVKIAANDRTGDVVVVVAGRDFQTSMIEDNVVAGLRVLEDLKSGQRGGAPGPSSARAA